MILHRTNSHRRSTRGVRCTRAHRLPQSENDGLDQSDFRCIRARSCLSDRCARTAPVIVAVELWLLVDADFSLRFADSWPAVPASVVWLLPALRALLALPVFVVWLLPALPSSAASPCFCGLVSSFFTVFGCSSCFCGLVWSCFGAGLASSSCCAGLAPSSWCSSCANVGIVTPRSKNRAVVLMTPSTFMRVASVTRILGGPQISERYSRNLYRCEHISGWYAKESSHPRKLLVMGR